MAIFNTLTYEMVADAIKNQKDATIRPVLIPMIRQVLPNVIAADIIGNQNMQSDEIDKAIQYMEDIIFSDKDTIVLKKSWTTAIFDKNPISITHISLDMDKYSFLIDSNNLYNAHRFIIHDNSFTGITKTISKLTASSETLQKMAYKYCQLVECIENRYDLTLEDLIMRF